jgi:hypothetical protein
MNFIKRLFQKPSAPVLAQAELDEAHRELLASESHRDLAAAEVEYNRQRIARLERYLGLNRGEEV